MNKWYKKLKQSRIELAKNLDMTDRTLRNYEKHGIPVVVEMALKWLAYQQTRKKMK